MLKPFKISEYKSKFSINWKLTMPNGCPPEDIEVPDEHKFVRLTHDINGTLTEDDLLTYSELYPDKDWGDKKFQSLGLSVNSTVEAAKRLLKLPYIRNNNLQGAAELCLVPTDGVVKQTGKKTHYTWWQTTSYVISNYTPIAI